MQTLGMKKIGFGRKEEMRAVKARLIRNAEHHLEAKGEVVEEVSKDPYYDNCLRGQLLVGTTLDRLRISAKLAISYWRYGKELRQELCQRDEIFGVDRWMAPKYLDMIARDGNGPLLSQMSQRGFGVDLGSIQKFLCTSVSSQYLDQYYISSRADYGSSLDLTHDTYGWISQSSLGECELPQIEGPAKDMLRLECKDNQENPDEKIWRYDSADNSGLADEYAQGSLYWSDAAEDSAGAY